MARCVVSCVVVMRVRRLQLAGELDVRGAGAACVGRSAGGLTQPPRQTPAGRAYLDLQNRARHERRGTQELFDAVRGGAVEVAPIWWTRSGQPQPEVARVPCGRTAWLLGS